MDTTKIYRGQITRTTSEAYGRVLGLKLDGTKDVLSLADLFTVDLLVHGNYVAVKYYVTREPIRSERLMPHDFSRVAGYTELVDAHTLAIGPFDFFGFLEDHLGWFAHLEILYNHAPARG